MTSFVTWADTLFVDPSAWLVQYLRTIYSSMFVNCPRPMCLYRPKFLQVVAIVIIQRLRPNSWTKYRPKVFLLLFAVISLQHCLEISISSISRNLSSVTVHCKRRKPNPLPYGLRNPYRNLKSENSLDYVQKPQQNCTFMNSASVCSPGSGHISQGRIDQGGHIARGRIVQRKRQSILL
jgi:hypothetical protein